MKNILEELYYGNIRPDTRYYSQNSEFVELARLKTVNQDKLLALLNDNGKDLFEKYSEAQSDMEDMIRYSNFTYGFKLGVLLMAEAFMDKEEIAGE